MEQKSLDQITRESRRAAIAAAADQIRERYRPPEDQEELGRCLTIFELGLVGSEEDQAEPSPRTTLSWSVVGSQIISREEEAEEKASEKSWPLVDPLPTDDHNKHEGNKIPGRRGPDWLNQDQGVTSTAEWVSSASNPANSCSAGIAPKPPARRWKFGPEKSNADSSAKPSGDSVVPPSASTARGLSWKLPQPKLRSRPVLGSQQSPTESRTEPGPEQHQPWVGTYIDDHLAVSSLGKKGRVLQEQSGQPLETPGGPRGAGYAGKGKGGGGRAAATSSPDQPPQKTKTSSEVVLKQVVEVSYVHADELFRRRFKGFDIKLYVVSHPPEAVGVWLVPGWQHLVRLFTHAVQGERFYHLGEATAAARDSRIRVTPLSLG